MIAIAATILAVAGLASAARAGPRLTPPFSDADWTLDFSDDFDTLDTSKWNLLNGTHGNQELEFYVPEQCSVKDGKLIQTAIEQKAYGHNYTSCWVDTQDKYAFRGGRFEVNARLPWGKGTWPAHWLMPQGGFCWPMGGEIDIMEAVDVPSNRVHAAFHYSNYTVGPCPCYEHESNVQNFSDYLPKGATLFNETFTTFGVVWEADTLSFYYNDTTYVTVPAVSQKIVANPFYFILNLAIGGSWPGAPDKETVFPQEHVIDWVRHYELKPGA